MFTQYKRKTFYCLVCYPPSSGGVDFITKKRSMQIHFHYDSVPNGQVLYISGVSLFEVFAHAHNRWDSVKLLLNCFIYLKKSNLFELQLRQVCSISLYSLFCSVLNDDSMVWGNRKKKNATKIFVVVFVPLSLSPVLKFLPNWGN